MTPAFQERQYLLLPTFSDNPDDWDSYHTLVDGAPAAITLDFAVSELAPLADRPGLLAVLIHMNDPGEHGLGDGYDPEALRHVEQQIVYAFEEKIDARFVGRIRSQGVWQLYFYAQEGEEIEKKATQLLSGFSGWEQELHIRTDPEWELYFELLYPRRERLQWIRNRKFCEILAGEGDLLIVPRRVDHYAYFTNAEDRERFIQKVKEEDYDIEELVDDLDEEDFTHRVQFYRTDSIELELIHEEVMKLVELAADFDGIYDDWETSVITSKINEENLPN